MKTLYNTVLEWTAHGKTNQCELALCFYSADDAKRVAEIVTDKICRLTTVPGKFRFDEEFKPGTELYDVLTDEGVDFCRWCVKDNPESFRVFVEGVTQGLDDSVPVPFLIDEWDNTAAVHRYHGYYDFAEAASDFHKWEIDSEYRGTVTLYKWNGTENQYEIISEITR